MLSHMNPLKKRSRYYKDFIQLLIDYKRSIEEVDTLQSDYLIKEAIQSSRQYIAKKEGPLFLIQWIEKLMNDEFNTRLTGP
jgi:hypothetical protein